MQEVGGGGPRRWAGAAGAPLRVRRPVDRGPFHRKTGPPGPIRDRRSGGLATARHIGARGSIRRCARMTGRHASTGPPPGMALTCTRTADSNRKALQALSSERICSPPSSEGGNRTLDRVIMGLVLCPTELLRWHNEPPAPNGTRRAMLSLSAPDRYAEPEPLFEPRSRYSVDERHGGGRPDSFGTSRTRRCRPGGTGRSGAGHPVRGTAAKGLHPLRRRRAIEDVRAVKEHSGCSRIRIRGNKKPRSSHVPAGVPCPGDRWRMFLPRVSRPMFGRPTS